MPMFQNASGVYIGGGSFTDVAGSINNYNNSSHVTNHNSGNRTFNVNSNNDNSRTDNSTNISFGGAAPRQRNMPDIQPDIHPMDEEGLEELEREMRQLDRIFNSPFFNDGERSNAPGASARPPHLGRGAPPRPQPGRNPHAQAQQGWQQPPPQRQQRAPPQALPPPQPYHTQSFQNQPPHQPYPLPARPASIPLSQQPPNSQYQSDNFPGSMNEPYRDVQSTGVRNLPPPRRHNPFGPFDDTQPQAQGQTQQRPRYNPDQPPMAHPPQLHGNGYNAGSQASIQQQQQPYATNPLENRMPSSDRGSFSTAHSDNSETSLAYTLPREQYNPNVNTSLPNQVPPGPLQQQQRSYDNTHMSAPAPPPSQNVHGPTPLPANQHPLYGQDAYATSPQAPSQPQHSRSPQSQSSIAPTSPSMYSQPSSSSNSNSLQRGNDVYPTSPSQPQHLRSPQGPSISQPTSTSSQTLESQPSSSFASNSRLAQPQPGSGSSPSPLLPTEEEDSQPEAKEKERQKRPLGMKKLLTSVWNRRQKGEK